MGKNALTSCEFSKLQREFCMLNRVCLDLCDGNFPCRKQYHTETQLTHWLPKSHMDAKRAMQSSTPPEICLCIIIVIFQLCGRRRPVLLFPKSAWLNQYSKLPVIVSTRVWPWIQTPEFGGILNSGLPRFLSKRQHCVKYFQSLVISLRFLLECLCRAGKQTQVKATCCYVCSGFILYVCKRNTDCKRKEFGGTTKSGCVYLLRQL